MRNLAVVLTAFDGRGWVSNFVMDANSILRGSKGLPQHPDRVHLRYRNSNSPWGPTGEKDVTEYLRRTGLFCRWKRKVESWRHDKIL